MDCNSIHLYYDIMIIIGTWDLGVGGRRRGRVIYYIFNLMRKNFVDLIQAPFTNHQSALSRGSDVTGFVESGDVTPP